MKFSLLALPALAAAAAIPEAIPQAAPLAHPMVTAAPLAKRGGTKETQLTDKVWTYISGGTTEKVTPTVIDGVTISGSTTTDSATVWASLDGSGIPYLITPTVSDGTTVSTSPTPTDSDYPDPTGLGAPPVLRCFGDRVPDSDTQGYPFCSALNGTEMVVGETYWLTWDPTYWTDDSDSITQVYIELVAYPQTGNDSDNIFTSDYVSVTDGYYPLTIRSQYIRSGNGYMWITITPLVTSQSDSSNVGTTTGPLVRAIISSSEAQTTISKLPSDNNIDTDSSSGSSNKAKVIAPAVVVPVVAVIAIAAAVVWYLQKQRKGAAGASGSAGAAVGSSTGQGEIHLSRTTTKDNASIITEETGHNPFQETSRTVL